MPGGSGGNDASSCMRSGCSRALCVATAAPLPRDASSIERSGCRLDDRPSGADRGGGAVDSPPLHGTVADGAARITSSPGPGATIGADGAADACGGGGADGAAAGGRIANGVGAIAGGGAGAAPGARSTRGATADGAAAAGAIGGSGAAPAGATTLASGPASGIGV